MPAPETSDGLDGMRVPCVPQESKRTRQERLRKRRFRLHRGKFSTVEMHQKMLEKRLALLRCVVPPWVHEVRCTTPAPSLPGARHPPSASPGSDGAFQRAEGVEVNGHLARHVGEEDVRAALLSKDGCDGEVRRWIVAIEVARFVFAGIYIGATAAPTPSASGYTIGWDCKGNCKEGFTPLAVSNVHNSMAHTAPVHGSPPGRIVARVELNLNRRELAVSLADDEEACQRGAFYAVHRTPWHSSGGRLWCSLRSPGDACRLVA